MKWTTTAARWYSTLSTCKGRCHGGCGRVIVPGDPIGWHPSQRKALCVECVREQGIAARPSRRLLRELSDLEDLPE